MRIGIDARSVNNNKICGVARYSICMLEALSEIDKTNDYFVYLDDIDIIPGLGNNFTFIKTNCSRLNFFKDSKFSYFVSKDNLDLFHSFHAWLPKSLPREIKKIVTIHDLFTFNDPDFFIKYKPFHKIVMQYFKRLTNRAVNQSDLIITISNFCKKEILSTFPAAKKKIEVVYNASGLKSAPDYSDQNRLINDDYLLYIGNCRSYKNINILIDGFNIFLNKKTFPEIKLVIAGNDNADLIKERVKRYKITDRVVFLANPSDIDICNLYSNAKIFIQPSKYEGFGIPVLEAMSFKVPVITSDAEALIDVAGDAGLFFDKNNPDELANSINRIINNNNLRDRLIEKGFERSRQFSWIISTQKIKKLFQKVLNK